MNETAHPLWTPSPERVARAGITRYLRWLADTHGRRFDDYEALWQWSVSDLEGFWASVWDFVGIRAHGPYERVLANDEMPGARWFPGATLNYAEHLLAHAQHPDAAARPAIVFRSEIVPRAEISWAQLAADTGALAATLERLGIEVGDRAVAFLPNIPQAVVALAATTGLGAIWSSSSPDMGPVSVLDRFRQIGPRVLFAVDGYRYGGKDFDRRDTVRDLVRQLPTLEKLIFVPYLDPDATLTLDPADAGRVEVVAWRDALARPAAPKFVAVPFDHPLWIVYSSGTTGMPKPIVHGHGGTTLENLKGGLLARDVGPGDTFFWFSSTSWIMWNLLASTLATGATIVQFDGNPGHPDLGTLWTLAERERITFFGISPAFVALNMKAGLVPRDAYDLSALRTIGATGSPLTEDAYRWIYDNVHPDVLLASISGGTDPGTAFMDSSPMLPVYAGEMQCRGLGVALHAYDDSGTPRLNAVGELVCVKPAPSMPLYFWNDPGGRRYFESYFDTFPGPPNVWRHGDWLKLIPRAESVTGVIYGRSDSTINRHGIRMGTSELYRVVEAFPEVADALVIDLEYLGRDSYMALFVVLRAPGSAVAGVGSQGPAPDGEAAGRAAARRHAAKAANAAAGKPGERTHGTVGEPAERADATVAEPGERAGDTGVPPALERALLDAIRTQLSSRHVPNDVFAIPEVPRTISGKKMEVPVKRILLGQPADRSVNRDAMANPGSIDWFVAFARGRGG